MNHDIEYRRFVVKKLSENYNAWNAIKSHKKFDFKAKSLVDQVFYVHIKHLESIAHMYGVDILYDGSHKEELAFGLMK